MIWNALLLAETIVLIPFLVSRLRNPQLKKRQEEMMERSGFDLIWMSIAAGGGVGFASDVENPYARLFRRATK